MIDWDKPVQTVSGLEATVYTTEGRDREYPVVGEVCYDDGESRISKWNPEGVAYGSNGKFPPYDLVNVPEKNTQVLNINREDNGYIWGHLYDSRTAADKFAASFRIACIEVTFTEGDGLNDDRFKFTTTGTVSGRSKVQSP